jgi:hypothetical protein
MIKLLHYFKGSPVTVSRVLYLIVFFTLVSLLTVPYVRLAASSFGKGIYVDNFRDGPEMTIAILLLFSLGFCWVNKKIFRAIKRESNRIWALHLPIDILLYGISVLLVMSMNAFWDKSEFFMRGLLDPVMLLLLLSAKYTFMQVWYANKDNKYASR